MSYGMHSENSAAADFAPQGQHDHDALPRRPMGSKVISTFDRSVVRNIRLLQSSCWNAVSCLAISEQQMFGLKDTSRHEMSRMAAALYDHLISKPGLKGGEVCMQLVNAYIHKQSKLI